MTQVRPPAPHSDRPVRSGYDRFVLVMRVILPAAALMTGGGALLWPLVNDREASFTLAREELVQRDDTIRVIGARYVGRDGTGKRFEVQAAEALQPSPGAQRVVVEGLEARMNLSEENAAYVRAERGIYGVDDHILEAADGVRLTTTDGYRVDTAGATVDLNAKTARSAGPVTGQSALGRFEAGEARLVVDDRALRLTQGVQMRIRPGEDAAAGADGQPASEGGRP